MRLINIFWNVLHSHLTPLHHIHIQGFFNPLRVCLLLFFLHRRRTWSITIRSSMSQSMWWNNDSVDMDNDDGNRININPQLTPFSEKGNDMGLTPTSKKGCLLVERHSSTTKLTHTTLTFAAVCIIIYYIKIVLWI